MGPPTVGEPPAAGPAFIGEERVILFNLSGHGLIDMASYDKYLSGDLVNYSLTNNDIQQNLDKIGSLV